MKIPLHTVTNDKDERFQIFYCEFPIEGSFDFGDELMNAEYLSKFADGTYESFEVVKEARCKCCNKWERIDAICSIHANSWAEALLVGLEHIG